MNKFEQGSGVANFEDMNFEQLETNEESASALQEAALEYLKTEDKEYFANEFSGELDSEGYLLKKDGTSSNIKPSQNISGEKAMTRVLEMAKEKLRSSVG